MDRKHLSLRDIWNDAVSPANTCNAVDLPDPRPRSAMSRRDEAREARFRRLYLAMYWDLLAYAMRRVPESMSHDVVAETFLVLWRRLDDVPDDDEARLWAYGVARKIVMNHHRSSRRLERLKARLHSLPPRQPDAADAPERAEAARVLDALRKLTDDEREVLLLSVWEDLSNAEIAAMVDCSVNAVAIRIHRARRHLERLCGKDSARPGHKEPGYPHAEQDKRRSRDSGLRPIRGASPGEPGAAGRAPDSRELGEGRRAARGDP